jgi:hypothetical protein
MRSTWPLVQRVVGLCEAVFDLVHPAGPVEGMAAPGRRWAVTVLRQVGELDAVVSEHRVYLVRHGLDQFLQEGPGSCARGLPLQPGEDVLGGAVHGHEEVELALSSANLGDVDVEEADRIAPEGLLSGFVAFDLG